jgi:hypothetical protein
MKVKFIIYRIMHAWPPSENRGKQYPVVSDVDNPYYIDNPTLSLVGSDDFKVHMKHSDSGWTKFKQKKL